MERTGRHLGHFLFVLWDGGGNIPPQLALARRLVEHGHRVRVLGPRVLRSRIEAAGCAFLPLHEAPEHDSSSRSADVLQDWQARTSLAAAARVRDRLIVGTALGYARDVSAAIADERPDVVVTDYMLLGAYLAAERAGVPLAALVHTIYPLPAPGLPPFGMGFPMRSDLIGQVRDALFGQVFKRFYNAGLGELNRARTALGLEPLTTVFAQFERANRLLVLTSQAFDFPATLLPANVRYVGPQLDDPAWLAPWQLPDLDEGKPLILVSLSTTYQAQEDIVRRVIAALAEMPVQGLVTLGPALDQNSFSLPANVRAVSYAPHVLVCPRADLVVTHGGHGTVITALSAGVPVVCLPMGRDQGDNAARVIWRGAGMRCSPRASVDSLRRTFQRVLAEPRYREGARRVAEGIARDGGPSRAIAELESLAPSVAMP